MSSPQFLAAYLILILAANFYLRWRIRQQEVGGAVYRLDSSADPYKIALLRGGVEEALRVTLFSLVDRGLLVEQNGLLSRGRPDAEDFVRRPLERAVLTCFAQPAAPQSAKADTAVKAALRECENELKRANLLANEETFEARFKSFGVMLGLVTGVGAWRALYALQHGRHNIGFLVLLGLIGCIALVLAYRRRRTGRGDAALERLQTLFASLKRRAAKITPGGASQEAVVLAAVFGLAALPAAHFPFIERLFPKPQGAGGDGGSSGSCDSDNSSCDGGGCGGGGCGGGCGG